MKPQQMMWREIMRPQDHRYYSDDKVRDCNEAAYQEMVEMGFGIFRDVPSNVSQTVRRAIQHELHGIWER